MSFSFLCKYAPCLHRKHRNSVTWELPAIPIQKDLQIYLIVVALLMIHEGSYNTSGLALVVSDAVAISICLVYDSGKWIFFQNAYDIQCHDSSSVN